MNEEKIILTREELNKMLLAEFKKGYACAKRAAAGKTDRNAAKSVGKADIKTQGEVLKFRGT